MATPQQPFVPITAFQVGFRTNLTTLPGLISRRSYSFTSLVYLFRGYPSRWSRAFHPHVRRQITDRLVNHLKRIRFTDLINNLILFNKNAKWNVIWGQLTDSVAVLGVSYRFISQTSFARVLSVQRAPNLTVDFMVGGSHRMQSPKKQWYFGTLWRVVNGRRRERQFLGRIA